MRENILDGDEEKVEGKARGKDEGKDEEKDEGKDEGKDQEKDEGKAEGKYGIGMVCSPVILWCWLLCCLYLMSHHLVSITVCVSPTFSMFLCLSVTLFLCLSLFFFSLSLSLSFLANSERDKKLHYIVKKTKKKHHLI